MESQLKHSSTGEVVNETTMRQLVEAAVLAPSADDNQPWLFRIDGNVLECFYDASRGLRSDVDNMFDMTALGAAIENAVIAARQLQFEPEVHYADILPSTAEAALVHPVARIELTTRASQAESLYLALKDRCTNRKPYAKQSLPSGQLDELSAAAESLSGVDVSWLSARHDIDQFAALVGSADRMRFEYKPFHQELYSQLRFTPAEAETTKDGLDIRTLELPFGAAKALYVLRKWSRMQLMNRLGLSRVMASTSAQQVRQSGAIGALTVETAGLSNFLNGGRAFERLWLQAAVLGLSLHPLGSIPIFVAHARRGDTGKLLPKHLARSREVANGVKELIPSLADREVQMCFRIGYSAGPSERSLRRPTSEVIERSGGERPRQ